MGGYKRKVGKINGTTNYMSYKMSGAAVYIIPTKVCTCLARLRNASSETTKGLEAFPRGESPGSLNKR